MNNKIVIAVDAMGGENSPNKIIDGIAHFSKNKKIFFLIYMEIKKKLKIVSLTIFQKIFIK